MVIASLGSETGLIALGDVVRVGIALLVLCIVPGYSLSVLARPCVGRLEHLVLALPCACALALVVGFAYAALNVPFGLLSYGVVVLAVVVLFLLREGRAKRLNVHWRAPAGRLWAVALVVALIDGVVIAVTYGGSVVPDAYDAYSHTLWTDVIAQGHKVTFALLSTPPGHGGFYPPGFHTVAALLVDATGVPAYRVIFYLAVAASLCLPAALYVYLRVVLDNARIAALAVALSLVFEPLPSFPLAAGIYPFIFSYLFVAAMALVLRDAIGRGQRPALLLAALLGVGLFYTHPTELLSVALLGIPAVMPLLRTCLQWGRAAAFATVLGTVWVVCAAPALAAVRATMVNGAQAEIAARHDFVSSAQTGIADALGQYLYLIYGRNVSSLLLIAVPIGIVWCLLRRRHLGLVAVQLLIAAILIDVLGPNLLRPFYVLSFPWALGERLAPLHYWVVPALAALGLSAIVAGARSTRLLRDRVRVVLIAIPIGLLGGALPFDVAVRHTQAVVAAHHLVGEGDLAALTWLARHARGEAVLNDADTSSAPVFDVPIDAGRWAPLLARVTPFFGLGGAGPGPLGTRVAALRQMGDATLSPTTVRVLRRDRVGYVYYGAAIPLHVSRHLDLRRLLHAPYLRLVYSSAAAGSPARSNGVAYVFALTLPGAG